MKVRPRDTGERRGVGRCCRVRLLPWEQLSRQPGLPARSFLQQREDRSIYCIIRKSWFWGSAGGGEIKPPAATCHLQGPEQQTRTNLVLGPRARLRPTCVLHQNPAPVSFLQAPKVRAWPLSGSLLPPASTRLPRGARLPRISVGLRGFNLITPSLLHAGHPVAASLLAAPPPPAKPPANGRAPAAGPGRLLWGQKWENKGRERC